MTHTIDFEPIGRRGECREGDTLLEHARALGVDLVNICGGAGSCGTCLVQVLAGQVSPIEESERDYISDDELEQGYRLACFAIPGSDCKVRIPAESLATVQRTQVEGQEIPVEPDPLVHSLFLELVPPSLQDLRDDASRVGSKLEKEYGLETCSFDHQVLSSISTTLRANDWQVNAVLHGNEVIALTPSNVQPLGVAVDLGTTKIAMYLLELETGKTLASRGLMNPQISYGEDIMTRMSAVQNKPDVAAHFQQLIVSAFNETIADMCSQTGSDPSYIADMVVVGNTAMHHLFLGYPVDQLGKAPYVPAVSSALDVKVRDLGINIAPGAYVHVLPNIAGYVGADHVSMLLASGIADHPGNVLALDIGTNTEICLSHNGKMSSLSTASGPAFEGAHIKFGMRAAPGAIERFQIVNGVGKFQTIENATPVGICGSGILDILAQLFDHGIVNQLGRMQEHAGVRGAGAAREYLVAPSGDGGSEVTFTQKDVEQLQLSKGAIRTGIDVLLSRQNLSPQDLDEVVIAGAFGTYLYVRSAITIGMLPPVPVDRVRQVGNAAGVGARQVLISQVKRRESNSLASRVEYVELAGYPDFMKFYANAMWLGR